MEQIAAGADEAAGAAQEQFAAVKSVASNLMISGEAETSRRRTETVQAGLGEAALQITNAARRSKTPSASAHRSR